MTPLEAAITPMAKAEPYDFDDRLDDESETYRLAEPDPPLASDRPPPRTKRKRRKRGGKPPSGGGAAAGASTPLLDEDWVSEDESWETARREKEARLGFAHEEVAREGERPLISALWYPFTGHGAIVLPMYTGLLFATELIALAMVSVIAPFLLLVQIAAQLLLGVYIGLLLLETAGFTLERTPCGPRMPSLDWQSFTAGMMALCAVLIARLPHMIGAIVLARLGRESDALLTVLLALGIVYLPMAFLALADMENEWALNPLVVFRGMARMGATYFILTAAAAAVYLAVMLPVTLTNVPEIIVRLVGSATILYVATVLMRAVALVYRRRGLSLE